MKDTFNPLLIKLAKLIRDITGKPESEIKIGRENLDQTDFATGYITVDSLAGSNILSSGEKFDEDNEQMSYDNIFKTEALIECYGDTAHATANRLVGLLRSQDAADKKYTLGITVYRVSSVQDIKQLTGQKYGNRLQLSVMVEDSRRVDIATKRIETVPFKILTEDGEITP